MAVPEQSLQAPETKNSTDSNINSPRQLVTGQKEKASSCALFRLDIRMNFFTKGAAKHWDQVPRLLGSPSLEVFRYRLDIALSAMIWLTGWR